MKSLIFLLLAGCSVATTPHTGLRIASYEQKQVRYMAPLDLINTLIQTFGAMPYPGECTQLTASNRTLLGDSSAATGSPIFSEPSSNFVRWYVGCVNQYTQNLQSVSESSAIDSAGARSFYGATLSAARASKPSLQNSPFNSLDRATQVRAVVDHIDQMIGPSDVVADFGFYLSSEAMAEKIATDVAATPISVEDAMRKIMMAIALRDEFMSY